MDFDLGVVAVFALMLSVPILFVAWLVEGLAGWRRRKREANQAWRVPPELQGPVPRPVRFKAQTFFGPAVIFFGTTAYAYGALFSRAVSFFSWDGLWIVAGPFLCVGLVRGVLFLNRDDKHLLQWGSITQGTITRRRYCRSSTWLDYDYSPTPSTRRVAQHYARAGNWTFSLRPGDSVSVLYDPQNDENSALYPLDRWKVRS